jgi:hypothetical protein
MAVDIAVRVKEQLVELAHDDLPGNMMDIYAGIVVTCLTCLDEDNVSFRRS